jgi:endonuclease III
VGDFTAAWLPDTALGSKRARMSRVAAKLADAYGTPDLGNHPDPLDEACWILLTYQTDLARARDTYLALRRRWPSWSRVAAAPGRELEDVLRPSGFQKARSTLLQQLLRSVHHRFGKYDLNDLRTMDREGAERELRMLPGMEFKGARCVLLYSLGLPVFPVDSNTFRFMQRYGVLSESSRFRRKTVHDGLERLVPPGCRLSLHVNLVVHGQRTCIPGTPRCPVCTLRRSCPTGRALS